MLPQCKSASFSFFFSSPAFEPVATVVYSFIFKCIPLTTLLVHIQKSALRTKGGSKTAWPRTKTWYMPMVRVHLWYQKKVKKIRRGPKLEGSAFANFENSSGTEGEPSQKREKNVE